MLRIFARFALFLALTLIVLGNLVHAGSPQTPNTVPSKNPQAAIPSKKGNERVPSLQPSQRVEFGTAPSAITPGTPPERIDQKQPASFFGGAMDVAKEYAETASAIGTLSASLIALYLGSWRTWFQRPRLRVHFREKHTPAYFRCLGYDPTHIKFVNEDRSLAVPGFNARVKICNGGKTTATGVRARVEKIVFVDAQKGPEEILYHPTAVKWSGERDCNAVDISPHSHFFLDVIWSKSERLGDVVSFNRDRYPDMPGALLQEIVENDMRPSGEVFWNVWADFSYDRGIPTRYDRDGEFTIYFIVDAANASPIRFEAVGHWTSGKYDSPTIRIRQGKRYINND